MVMTACPVVVTVTIMTVTFYTSILSMTMLELKILPRGAIFSQFEEELPNLRKLAEINGGEY